MNTLNLENIAEICHEANRIYCKNIGDTTQSCWEYSEYWQKKSAINGVKNVLKNPNSTHEDSHKSWFREKELEGWVFGEEKNSEKKTHPCMRPYEELPKDQRNKDKIFIGIAKLLLSIE